ncbi:MAG: PorV/PorQ family protein [candidate division Zixibacteria bacterium]|nr:PorV/PorQ family protein [candidate division Zixibacteria bacterium]
MRNIITAILIALALSATVMASSSNTGRSAYSFLKVGVSAKSQALAGAYVGLADDISCLYSNPGGLTAAIYDLNQPTDYYYEEDIDIGPKKIVPKTNRFLATYTNYLLDFQTGYLAYVRTLSDKSSLGVSIQYQDYGSFDRLDSTGQNLGTFGAIDMALGLTYSERLTESFSVGITGKFIFEKIDSSSSDAMAVDLGWLLRFDEGRTSLGWALRNLGSQLKGHTKSHKDPLPLLFDFGISHSLRGMPLTVNADITTPIDNNIYFSIGGQFEAFQPFFIRLGWSSQGLDYKTGSDKDRLGGFAGGFGYHLQDYNIDYSYSSFADIGNVHRISLGYDF